MFTRYWPTLPQMGMLIFLASLSMFFGALILAYGMTLGQRPPVHIAAPAALWLSTGAITASAGALYAARRSLGRARVEAYRRWVAWALVTAILFLVSQAAALNELREQGVYLAGNPHGSVFYAFTGIHGAHVVAGLAALILLLRAAAKLSAQDSEQPIRRNRNRATLTAWYWNFVTASWFVLFGLLLRWS